MQLSGKFFTNQLTRRKNMKIAVIASVLISFLAFSTYIQAKIKSTTSLEDFPSTEYRIGLFMDTALDLEKITHIIVVGSAVKEDSDQFFQSGISRALRFKELYPDHQVVIMSSPDVLNSEDLDIFIKYNILVVKKVLEKFTAQNMLIEMNLFKSIASFDFYGHASPWALKIGDTHAAFSPYENQAALIELRNKFLPNAFVTLNACSTGFMIAPDLSEILKIPVSGTLSSSMFETIESDGFWYKEEDSHKENYVLSNKTSYNQNVLCSLGFCTRMKSSRENYNSYWGHYTEGGLSFSKFFCNFDNSDGHCERGMAKSIYALPSIIDLHTDSNTEDFKKVVYDWLCSTGVSKNYFNKCITGIEESIARYDLIYQSHPTNELMCDFKSCTATVICQFTPNDDPIPGSCHLKTPLNPEPTNISREFLSFMKGYNDLNMPIPPSYK